jgi:hypothetical protein
MKKNCFLILSMIFAFAQFVFTQESSQLLEYLKKNPDLEKSYKLVKESFLKDPTLDTMTNDLIAWHKGLINSQLNEPIKKMIEAWVKDPANYESSKEYTKAEKAFDKIVKESFKKDDKFMKELGSDELAKWIFNTGAFLSTVYEGFTISEQEQAKSYRVESIIILHYTRVLMSIISSNNRDEEKVAQSFKKLTKVMITWLNGIPVELRK